MRFAADMEGLGAGLGEEEGCDGAVSGSHERPVIPNAAHNEIWSQTRYI